MRLDPADERVPLKRLVDALRLNDAEMAEVLRLAARESEQILRKYNLETFSGKVRQAQLDLARVQRQLWASVGDMTRIGIGDGADAAAESAAFLDNLMFEAVGGTATFWREALLAQARAGIPNIISRRLNNVSLSERVYKNGLVSSGRISDMIDGLIGSGASAKEIARRVVGFIDPNTPGGASYAAMRLGRTELNNAFHTTTVRLNEDKPWVRGMQWRLSGSHPKPDICNSYASQSSPLGAGVYAAGDVPTKPHPQCLCFVVPVTVSRKDFINSFNAGHYDNYLNGLGCRSA